MYVPAFRRNDFHLIPRFQFVNVHWKFPRHEWRLSLHRQCRHCRRVLRASLLPRQGCVWVCLQAAPPTWLGGSPSRARNFSPRWAAQQRTRSTVLVAMTTRPRCPVWRHLPRWQCEHESRRGTVRSRSVWWCARKPNLPQERRLRRRHRGRRRRRPCRELPYHPQQSRGESNTIFLCRQRSALLRRTAEAPLKRLKYCGAKERRPVLSVVNRTSAFLLRTALLPSNRVDASSYLYAALVFD